MLTIIFMYAEGCAHCETIKPVFDRESHAYSGTSFVKKEISEAWEIYNKHAERNEDGTIKVVIPNFYIYDSDEISEENPDGFVGGFEGAQPGELEAVLKALHEAV